MLDQSKQTKLRTYLGLSTLILSAALVDVVVAVVAVHLIQRHLLSQLLKLRQISYLKPLSNA